MNFLRPVMTNESPSRRASVRSAVGSDPAPGGARSSRRPTAVRPGPAGPGTAPAGIPRPPAPAGARSPRRVRWHSPPSVRTGPGWPPRTREHGRSSPGRGHRGPPTRGGRTRRDPLPCAVARRAGAPRRLPRRHRQTRPRPAARAPRRTLWSAPRPPLAGSSWSPSVRGRPQRTRARARRRVSISFQEIPPKWLPREGRRSTLWPTERALGRYR